MIDTPPPSVFMEKVPALVAQYRIEANMRSLRERLRVLIVEDQLFSRRILQQMLHSDFTLDVASSARAGMKLFMEQAPDIILLDIGLEDESGHKLAGFIKHIEPEAFIVMVTANHSAADVSEAKKNEVDGFIVKPYNKNKIYEFIHKYWELNPDRKPEGSE